MHVNVNGGMQVSIQVSIREYTSEYNYIQVSMSINKLSVNKASIFGHRVKC